MHHSKDSITPWPGCHKCHAVRTKISHFQGLVNRLEVSNKKSTGHGSQERDLEPCKVVPGVLTLRTSRKGKFGLK